MDKLSKGRISNDLVMGLQEELPQPLTDDPVLQRDDELRHGEL